MIKPIVNDFNMLKEWFEKKKGSKIQVFMYENDNEVLDVKDTFKHVSIVLDESVLSVILVFENSSFCFNSEEHSFQMSPTYSKYELKGYEPSVVSLGSEKEFYWIFS